MSEIVYHEIEERIRYRRGAMRLDFITRVFRGGELVALNLDTGESTYAGGELVATLYRDTYAGAMRAAMTYSHITRRAA